MFWQLLSGVKTELETLFAETRYEARPDASVPGQATEKAWRAPQVHIGDLPLSEVPADPAAYAPYILLRLCAGKTAERSGVRVHLPRLRIICGIWTADGAESQHQSIAQMQYRIVQWLCQTRLVGGKWRRVFPLRWGAGATGDVYAAAAQSFQCSAAWIDACFEARAETDDIGPAFITVYGSDQGE